MTSYYEEAGRILRMHADLLLAFNDLNAKKEMGLEVSSDIIPLPEQEDEFFEHYPPGPDVAWKLSILFADPRIYRNRYFFDLLTKVMREREGEIIRDVLLMSESKMKLAMEKARNEHDLIITQPLTNVPIVESQNLEGLFP